MSSPDGAINAACFLLATMLTFACFDSYMSASFWDLPFLIIAVCVLAVFMAWFALFHKLASKIRA